MQDVWANIWCAVLAGEWRVVRVGIRWAGSGGAAVALAVSKPYIISTWRFFKCQKCLSVAFEAHLSVSVTLGTALDPQGWAEWFPR